MLLLDLKMPKMDGFEVLEEIRKSEAFRRLRVIVLTSSEDIKDVNRAYELGANSFLVKPLEFDNFTQMMRTLSRFWLHTCKTPAVQRPAKATNPNGGHTSSSA
jgi:CheY-like chemotaxis protein